MKTEKQYKDLTIREFTKAADVYESSHAGIYEMCKEDYPYISHELAKEDYTDLLDCGCGTGPMISLLYEEDASKHYTGIDITPRMIEVAKAKGLSGVSWVVGDCEDLPFEDNSFDAVICSNSFHHYPNPQKFFDSVKRVLRPGGRLILQDYTAPGPVLWLMNHTEMPLANLVGHGDVGAYSLDQVREICRRSGLNVEKLERGKKFRLHLVARKREIDIKARSGERLEHVTGKGEGMTTHKLKKQYYSPATDGFYGAFYECPVHTEKAVILMLGDAVDDRMAVSGVKWLHQQGCHVMAMAPAKKDYGHHNYPLERFGKAIEVLQEKGISKIGIVGASTTGMLALVAASYYPQISLTVAISPPDFIMEGFYQDGRDGMRERPGNNESSVSWEGKPLPYLPYAYRHPEYWQKIKEESKEGKDMIASRSMFDESERRHPLQEEEKIRVEKIQGKILCIGAEDDVLWDTCKYIRRMEERLKDRPHSCRFKALLYEHGTHFAFPESMLRIMLPVGGSLLVGAAFRAGREYPKECRETRRDIDRKLRMVIRKW